VSAGSPHADGVTIRRGLRLIRWVALLDGVLLVPLVAAALSHAEGAVDVLGPIHGGIFLILMFLVVRGVANGWWGWWFPTLVLLTAGPPGALLYELRATRRLSDPRD
jgi:hypothetical protein